jgi:hypothetical protein
MYPLIKQPLLEEKKTKDVSQLIHVTRNMTNTQHQKKKQKSKIRQIIHTYIINITNWDMLQKIVIISYSPANNRMIMYVVDPTNLTTTKENKMLKVREGKERKKRTRKSSN